MQGPNGDGATGDDPAPGTEDRFAPFGPPPPAVHEQLALFVPGAAPDAGAGAAAPPRPEGFPPPFTPTPPRRPPGQWWETGPAAGPPAGAPTTVPPEPAPSPPTRPRTRVAALDAARGLAVAGMLLVENLPAPHDTFTALRHAAWNGFTLADLVFPAFLVLVGTSLAFSLAPPLRPGALGRLARRALVLVVLGLLFNAWGTSGADLSELRFPGVLQRIGLAGLVAGWIVVAARWRWWVVAVVAFVLLGATNLVLARWPVECGVGVADPACTVAGAVDAAVLGPSHLYAEGRAGPDPEGLFSTLGAVASVLVGWLGGQALRLPGRGFWGPVERLGVLSLGLVLASPLLWSDTPVNKKLWTPPFVLLTAGITLGVLLVLYVVADRTDPATPLGRAGRALAWPWEVLGRNALVVYVGQHLVAVALASTPVVTAAGTITATQWLLWNVFGGSPADPTAGVAAFAATVLVAWWLLAWLMHRWRWYVTV